MFILIFILLVIDICGAWYVYEYSIKRPADLQTESLK